MSCDLLLQGASRSVELVLSPVTAGRHGTRDAGANVGNAPFFPPPLSWLFSRRARALHRLVRANAVAVGATYVNRYRHRADDPFARDPQRLIALDHLHRGDEGYVAHPRGTRPCLETGNRKHH